MKILNSALILALVLNPLLGSAAPKTDYEIREMKRIAKELSLEVFHQARVNPHVEALLEEQRLEGEKINRAFKEEEKALQKSYILLSSMGVGALAPFFAAIWSSERMDQASFTTGRDQLGNFIVLTVSLIVSVPAIATSFQKNHDLIQEKRDKKPFTELSQLLYSTPENRTHMNQIKNLLMPHLDLTKEQFQQVEKAIISDILNKHIQGVKTTAQLTLNDILDITENTLKGEIDPERVITLRKVLKKADDLPSEIKNEITEILNCKCGNHFPEENNRTYLKILKSLLQISRSIQDMDESLISQENLERLKELHKEGNEFIFLTE